MAVSGVTFPIFNIFSALAMEAGGVFTIFTVKARAMTGDVFTAFAMKTDLEAAWNASGFFAFAFTMKRLVRLACHKSRAGLFTMVFII